MSELLWPVYEFRPLDEHQDVLRYADGQWIKDDGQYDIAFVARDDRFTPFGLYVDLPYQRNIIWKGLTRHWRDNDPNHPDGNPWHYMLREGETEWGGPWPTREFHPNRRMQRAAMDKCSSIYRCANGRGPRFEFPDRYIERRLLRERETKAVVEYPRDLSCMHCGGEWLRALTERAAA